MSYIDRVAWVRVEEEIVWLSYADRERSAPVDKIIFDWLRERGELR